MDSFEDLLKGFYEEKKKEDEKSIPDFAFLVHVGEKAKPAARLIVIRRLAVSAAALAITVLLIWKITDRGESKKLSATAGHEPLNYDMAGFTDWLLNAGNGPTYIWDWKSPTDGLLDLRHKYLNDKKL